MQGLLFVLKGDYPELAAAEAKALVHGWRFWEDKTKSVNNTLFFKKKKNVPETAGLTHRVIDVKISCGSENILRVLSSTKWNLKGTYKVRLLKLTESNFRERAVAQAIYNNITEPQINLKNPDNVIDVVITEKAAYAGFRVWEDKENWRDRKASKWPAPHPTAMPPHVARAMMNLSCAKKVHDPFCGAGGYLIEGALAGKIVSGADLYPEMIARAKKNTRHFNLKPNLRVTDAIDWLPRVQAMVSDLPYGKNTKNLDFSALLEAFLVKARLKTNRLVICIHEKLPKTENWTVRFTTKNYVHKLMTRYYYVLEAK